MATFRISSPNGSVREVEAKKFDLDDGEFVSFFNDEGRYILSIKRSNVKQVERVKD